FDDLCDDGLPSAFPGLVFEEKLGAASACDQTSGLQGQDAQDFRGKALRNPARFQEGCGSRSPDHRTVEGAYVAEAKPPNRSLLLFDSPAADRQRNGHAVEVAPPGMQVVEFVVNRAQAGWCFCHGARGHEAWA